LRVRNQLPEATVEQLWPCQRGGCDVGTADLCAVARKTVHRCQRVAPSRGVKLYGPGAGALVCALGGLWTASPGDCCRPDGAGLTLGTDRRGCWRLGRCWLASVGGGNRLSFHPLTLGHQVHGKQ
jgi:hypothetical protein